MKVIRLGLGLVLVTLLGAAACEGTAGTTDGAAGEGSVAGDAAGGDGQAQAGSEAMGGAAGQQAEGGASGDAGSVGIAGELATAGAGGEQGGRFEVRDCNDQVMDIDPDWVNYCVVLAGCTETEPAWCLMSPQAGYSFYFGSPHSPPYDLAEPGHDRFELASCKTSITTCDDLLACSGWRTLQGECDSDHVARCEGERAINCGSVADVAPGVEDCERLTGKKGTCQVSGVGQAARAQCVVQETCNAPGTQTCDGTKVVRCDAEGVAVGEDCAEFGLACRVSSAGRALCAPPLPTATCDNKGQPYCDGNSAAYCNPDGIAFKGPDCGAIGDMVCSGGGGDNVDDNWWDCVPKGCSITEWAGMGARCDGDVSEYAMGYWTVRVNCRDYGFASCKNGRCGN